MAVCIYVSTDLGLGLGLDRRTMIFVEVVVFCQIGGLYSIRADPGMYLGVRY